MRGMVWCVLLIGCGFENVIQPPVTSSSSPPPQASSGDAAMKAEEARLRAEERAKQNEAKRIYEDTIAQQEARDAKAMKQAKLNDLRSKLDYALSRKFTYGTEGAEAGEAVVKAYKALKEFDVSEAEKMKPKVDTWSADMQATIEEEKACRANPKCSDSRAAEPICAALSGRESARQEMMQEKSNPSGYVNLSRANELGRIIQNHDMEIADLKKEFAASQKKPFAASMCSAK